MGFNLAFKGLNGRILSRRRRLYQSCSAVEEEGVGGVGGAEGGGRGGEGGGGGGGGGG